LEDTGRVGDSALNLGGPALYLWEGERRYRLFLRRAVDIVDGNEYIAEGVNAQKAIDDIGDPDQGKNGYPLESSCERVVRMAWGSLAFDEAEAQTALLLASVKRYPARPVFLVTRISPVTSTQSGGASGEPKKQSAAEEEKNLPIVSVAAEKQQASLVEGSPVRTAPLWAPEGGTVPCKVLIDSQGKISALETGVQLCESVPWSEFRYRPLVQGGRPVKVRTEVEVRFEPRK
jgi:hypothetical protein